MGKEMNFACQESCKGKCCTFDWDGRSEWVFLTEADAKRIERFLGKPLSEFANLGEFNATRFANYKTWQWYLKSEEYGCPFFKDGKCGIYEARPTQCRTYPYWPEVIADETLHEVCPGIGKGENKMQNFYLTMQRTADAELRGHRCQ